MSDTGKIHYLAPPDEEDRQLVKFEPFYVSEMEGTHTPQREWLIDGVLQRGTVLLFAGATKIGKSMLLQQMLTAVSIGQPWLERETVASRALGIFTEDPKNELRFRQEDLNYYYDRNPADFDDDLALMSLAGDPDATLVEFGRYDTKPRFTDLWERLWIHVEDTGTQIVGLDNMKVLFGGIEQFSNQVTIFVRHLVRKAIEINGAIIIAHHPPKADDEGFAGSGAWLASTRGGMSLRRPQDWDRRRDGLRDPRRVLAGLGTNYGGHGIGHESLEIRDGVFVTVDNHGEARPRQRAQAPLTDQQMIDLRYELLTGCRNVLQNGGVIVADVTHRHSMPKRAKAHARNEWVRKARLNDLERAQDLMLEAGQLVRVDVKGKCLLRPAEGPYYREESPWLPVRNPVQHAAD